MHVLEPRVVPNGRRDDFETSAHLDNIVTHLRPVASEIARECRVSSQRRNRLKAFEFGEGKVAKNIEIIRQGAVSEKYAQAVKGEIGSLLAEMQKAAEFELFEDGEKEALKSRYDEIQAGVNAYSKRINGSVFDSLPQRKRAFARGVFGG